MQDFQTEIDAFHAQIGYCIAQWARVDDELFRIFRECLSAPLEQSAIVYYRLPGIDIRLNATDEMVLSRLPRPERASGGHQHPSVKEWKAIKNSVQDQLGTRRRIAHHPVNANGKFMQIGLSTDAIAMISWFEIAAGQNEQLRTKSTNDDALDIDDLKDHWRAVNDLCTRLVSFFFDHVQERTLSQLPPSPQLNSENSKDRETS